MVVTMFPEPLSTVRLPLYDGFDNLLLLPMLKTVSVNNYLNTILCVNSRRFPLMFYSILTTLNLLFPLDFGWSYHTM